MRVTQRSIALTSLQGLGRSLDAINRLQQQLTSGKVINTPSDSPVGTNKAMQLRRSQAANDQYALNITDGTGQLDTTDSALQSMLSLVHKVRELTVQGLNEGGLSADARQNIRTELLGLRESMLGVANTAINGRPVFGGVTTGQQAYDPATGTYLGVGGAGGGPVYPVNRRVGDTTVVRTDITGPEAFADPTGVDPDLFALVQKIADDVVAADPSPLGDDLSTLDRAQSRLLTAAADIGTRAARLDQAAQVNADRKLSLQSQLADVENIDLPKTIMELQMQKTGYQAALAATAQAIQPTLLDFLR